jgi:hypothetical protein
MAMFVEDQFHGRSKFKNAYPLPVSGFVPNRPHNLRPGNIRCHMDPLSACTAEMKHLETTIRILIEHCAQTLEPLKHGGGMGHQGINQLRDIGEVASADRIKVMVIRRIFPWLGGHLDTPFGHHRIGIAVSEFGGNGYLRTIFSG